MLSEVDVLLLAEVYAAGEAPIVAADGRALARAIRLRGRVEPLFVPDIAEMPSLIPQTVQDGDVVMTMGAGSIGNVAQKVVQARAEAPMWSDPQSINRFALAMGALASLALLWCAVTWAGSRGMFALRQVRVVAPLAEVDTGVLESAIRTDLRGTFFSVSPQRVRTTLRKLLGARPDRAPPLAVCARPRHPMSIAVVGYWGDNDLLSDAARCFVPAPRRRCRASMDRRAARPKCFPLSRGRAPLAAHGLDIKAFAMSPVAPSR